MTINQDIAFCLVAVLIGFLVCLAVMAKHAVELLKKTKTLADKSNEAVDDVKGRFNRLSDDAIEAVSAVAADTSGAVKALTVAGAGLTALGLLKFLVRLLTGSSVFSSMSTARERKRAKKEIKLSKQTIKGLNKQAELEKKARKKAAKKTAKFQKQDAKAAAKASKKKAKIDKKEAAAAAKAAAATAALMLKKEKAEKKKALKAAAAAAMMSMIISSICPRVFLFITF